MAETKPAKPAKTPNTFDAKSNSKKVSMKKGSETTEVYPSEVEGYKKDKWELDK